VVSASTERTKVRNWYTERRFSLLLLAQVLVFAVHPMLHGFGFGSWLYDLFITLVFLAAFLVVFNRKGRRLAALVLGVPTVVANWTGYVLPGLPAQPLALTFHLFSTVFLGFAVVTILQTIYESKAVTTDGLAGAFGGYLLAGVAFAHLFTSLEIAAPGSFHLPAEVQQSELQDGNQRREIFNYYSFITLTTVGYGDIYPVSHSARSLACTEAIVGQFYIAVVMALLIGQRLAQAGGGEKPRPP
jgi:voltage-gated potassium channel